MTTGRRRFLGYATTLLAGIGIGLATLPLIRSWRRNPRSVPHRKTVQFPKLKPGQLLATTSAFQTPIYVLFRTPEMLNGLADFPGLADPESMESSQPEHSRNQHRSLRPDILVVDAMWTHSGCAVAYFPPSDSPFPFSDEFHQYGVFFCPCHGSTYDLAGRVVTGQPAPHNLRVPNYRFTGEMEIEIG